MEEDRRKHHRHKLSYPVRMITSLGSMVGETKDLNGDGAFISCLQPLNPEENMTLNIKLPEGLPVKVSSQVVWSCITSPDDKEKQCGMGVRFLW